MSKFLYHEPCPACGSKDNLAVYDDGHKYCFGCHWQEQGLISLRNVFKSSLEAAGAPQARSSYPSDAQSDFIRLDALQWLLKSHITQEQRQQWNIQWSPNRQMLCWPITAFVSNARLGWQGRCFAPDAKTKTVIYGSIHDNVCVLAQQWPLPNTVVMVEDYISAIRVSTYYPCVPLFGCNSTIRDLETLFSHFDKLVVWLDSDKLDNARKIAQKASLIGFDARVCYTELDPKAYSNEDIKNYLKVFK